LQLTIKHTLTKTLAALGILESKARKLKPVMKGTDWAQSAVPSKDGADPSPCASFREKKSENRWALKPET
jgi:hypothetical protein